MSTFRKLVAALKARNGSEAFAVAAALALELMAHMGKFWLGLIQLFAICTTLLALAYLTNLAGHGAAHVLHLVGAH